MLHLGLDSTALPTVSLLSNVELVPRFSLEMILSTGRQVALHEEVAS